MNRQLFKEHWPYHKWNIFKWAGWWLRERRFAKDFAKKYDGYFSEARICRNPGETDDELRPRIKRINDVV